MNDTPILLVPGLNCTGEIFAGLLPALWQFGPVTIANHRHGDSMEKIARAILADAPPRFVLGGFSMGGYIAFEIFRQTPDRVLAFASLDSSARPDSAQQSDRRRAQIAEAQAGRFAEVPKASFANMVHDSHAKDVALEALHQRMAMEVGAEAFVAHQTAIINRPDSRPDLAHMTFPVLAVVGEADVPTPPDAAREIVDGVSHGRLVVIPQAGHLALLEQPALYQKALVDWLTSPR